MTEAGKKGRRKAEIFLVLRARTLIRKDIYHSIDH